MSALVHSLNELRDRVQAHRRRLGISESIEPPWYRGISRIEYELLPGLLRHGPTKWETEVNLYTDFMTKGKRFFERSYDSWELLSVMQHHGMPTRLLDWTTSLDAALFFAVDGKCARPALWILNPYELNRRAVKQTVLFDAADPLPYDYYEVLRQRQEPPHELPLAMAAPWTNDRIERQAGCFSVHGSSLGPLEEICRPALKRVQIADEVVPEIRQYLREVGRDAFSFFPDLDGLARSLRGQYGFG